MGCRAFYSMDSARTLRCGVISPHGSRRAFALSPSTYADTAIPIGILEANYNSHTFTADLAKVINAFGFKKITLIGHSWGAETVIRFAAANPAQVAGLVIVDFGPELAQTGVDEVLKGFAEMPRSFTSVDEFTKWLTVRRPLAEPRLLTHNLRATVCAIRSADPTR